MNALDENPSPRLQRAKWPILTMIAVAAGIIASQWMGSVWRGAPPNGSPPAHSPQEPVETTDPATP